ncbi:hypothetical protein D3C75_1174830 [compost metagenome]
MIAELGLHRALYGADWSTEHHGVELLDHLARAEGAQVAALTAGRAGGVGFGDFSEIGTGFDLSLQFIALVFSGNQDVTGSGFGHGSGSLG